MRTQGLLGHVSYTLEYADKQEPMDEVVETEGVKLLIDPKASLFLIGTEMDYVEEKLKSGFVFKNPEREGPLRLRRILPRLSRLVMDHFARLGSAGGARCCERCASLDRAYFAAASASGIPTRFVAPSPPRASAPGPRPRRRR